VVVGLVLTQASPLIQLVVLASNRHCVTGSFGHNVYAATALQNVPSALQLVAAHVSCASPPLGSTHI